MKLLARSISLAVMLSLVLGGPLAPFAAAQQPAPPGAMQDAAKTNEHNGASSPAYDVGAGLANVAYVPGKVVLCGLGIVAGTIGLLLTFGTAYRAAAAVGEEGCGGRWVLTGDDLRPTPRTDEAEHPGY
jgi:hypothetical protein